jgi:hypothetical protein
MNTKSWMRDLDGAKLLRQIVMPGSHDAGVYGTAQTILRTSAFQIFRLPGFFSKTPRKPTPGP